MRVICGYKSKEGILKNYMLIFSTFHLPAGGLHLIELPHRRLPDIIRLGSKGDIISIGDFH